ncbi:MAG: hypothetical protein U9P71_05430 [Campylobacterota bacterium]|nr:hypothetical protein [Campylobacterota bacterium]
MQLTLDIKDSAIDKILYFLEHLKDDVTIINKLSSDSLEIEPITQDDPDYLYVVDAKKRRSEGEKTYTIDEIIKDFQ